MDSKSLANLIYGAKARRWEECHRRVGEMIVSIILAIEERQANLPKSRYKKLKVMK